MIANDFLSRDFILHQWSRCERIAGKILSVLEYHNWQNQGRNKEELAKYWAAKEAAYKLTHALGIQDRRFLPKGMNCKWNDVNQLEVEYGDTTYFGQLQASDRGWLAWVCRNPQIAEVQHFWVPFKMGEKQPARQRMKTQWLQNPQTSDTLPTLVGRDSMKPKSTGDFACRTYSSPWAVMSVMSDIA